MPDDFDAAELLIAIDLVEQGGMPDQAARLRELVGPIRLRTPEAITVERAGGGRIRAEWFDGSVLVSPWAEAAILDGGCDYTIASLGCRFVFFVPEHRGMLRSSPSPDYVRRDLDRFPTPDGS